MSIIENIKKVRIGSPDDILDCAKTFAQIVHELCQLRVAASHNIASTRSITDADGNLLATSVFKWDQTKSDWWKTEALALKSPIPTACRYESEPFWINASGIYTRTDNEFLLNLDLRKFTERAKTVAAIVAPIHMPFGEVGAVSFNPLNEEETDLSAKFEAHADELAIYAEAFIRSYVKISLRSPILPTETKLSKREVECLRWAALGKTDHEIGVIISRSQATVRFHIRNATEKLESVNKSQAIFKATQLGYLSIKKSA